MKIFLNIALFLSLTVGTVKAELVNTINIIGNSRISDETVKVYSGIQKDKKDYSKQDLDNILKNIYETNFFEDVSVEIKNQVLVINLKEYPVLNQLVLIGEKSSRIKTEIKRFIQLKESNSFIKTYLDQDLNAIKKFYSSIGYNFADIKAKVKNLDKSNIDLIFEINKGNVSKISKISFFGDKKIKEKRLRDIIASEEDKFWKIITRNARFSENLINLDKRLLSNYYKSLGYYDVEVSSTSAEVLNTGNININYTINAGTRYTIKKITTNVDSVFDKNIFFSLNKLYNKYAGGYYSPFKIKKILDEIDKLIEINNLQFVEHQVQEIFENDEIILSFNIIEGEKVLVERINILGNSVTNEDVIRSELKVDEGDPLTGILLSKSISKIRSRNIFKSVNSEVKSGSKSDLKIIDIRVEEKPTGEISAGAGIGTNGGSFAINISENNWLGEGKKVDFELEVSQDSLKGEFNYQNPNYDLLGNAINYNLTNITNDKPDQGYENKLISAGVNTSFEQFKDIYANLGVDVSYDDLRTTSNASSSLKKQEGGFSELSINYGFSYDQRNRTFMPTEGFITGFNQTLPVYADKPFIGNTFTSSRYHSFNENIIGAGKFLLTTVNGLNDEDVRLSKRKSLSTTRLRGFEKGKVGPVDNEDHVGGNYAAAINLEANLPNFLPESTNTDIGFFLDAGNVWGVDYDDSIDDSNKIRSSTGVAASWLSPLGPMTFILATNISKASTDKTQSFNFNLGTSF
ncbi:MAG: outer membrane protein assembly factor BamA [Flavobacteriaceae bacterium]|nr:outer membrane protein assembly factor BamA [Flavobacteriaceae bacterium]